MQQELIEMLEEIIQYVEVWNAHDQGIIDKAEALIEKAKKSANEPAVPQGFKPVGYLRSDEFDGHVFEPIDGTWPFDELLCSLSTSPEPVQEVTLTDEEIGDLARPYGRSSINGFDHIKGFTRKIIAALREKDGK